MKLTDDELKMVSGGTEPNMNTNDGSDGKTMPFYCDGCGTTFEINLGDKTVICPHCGKTHYING